MERSEKSKRTGYSEGHVRSILSSLGDYEIRNEKGDCDLESPDKFNVQAKPPTNRHISEVGSSVLVYQSKEALLQVFLLSVSSDGDEVLEGGGEEGVDGGSSDCIQTTRFNGGSCDEIQNESDP